MAIITKETTQISGVEQMQNLKENAGNNKYLAQSVWKKEQRQT